MAGEDEQLRAAVFGWLDDKVALTGNLLSRRELLDARVAGRPLGLIDAGRGIRNPAGFAASLSVVSVPDSPYEDVDDGSGLVRYAFRTGDPTTGDNRKLLEAVRLGVPLVYFVRVQPGVYSAIYPVYAVEADTDGGGVLLDLTGAGDEVEPLGVPASEQRRYAASVARRRLHQVMFRSRVLVAYETSCAVCRLHEPVLLEASHIVGDAAGGEPVVQNGLSLCTIHHRAFDRNLLGVSPDHQVRIHPRILSQADGPMLRHGLQEMHGWSLQLPRRRADRPDRERLAQRFDRFLLTA
ncbi:MAG: HNH endonuclease [Pseudonocardiaceae bacterium]